MWPEVVVIETPPIDGFPGVVEAREPMEIQAFISEFPVEAFDETVFDRFARAYEHQFDAVVVGPLVEHAARELGPVVYDDSTRQWPRKSDLIEYATDPDPGQGSVDLDGEAFASCVIDDVERPQPSAIAQHIAHEVH